MREVYEVDGLEMVSRQALTRQVLPPLKKRTVGIQIL